MKRYILLGLIALSISAKAADAPATPTHSEQEYQEQQIRYSVAVQQRSQFLQQLLHDEEELQVLRQELAAAQQKIQELSKPADKKDEKKK